MKIETKATNTVSISIEEIKELIRKEYVLIGDINLIIKDSDVAPNTGVKEKDGWFYVPEDWNEDQCPHVNLDKEPIDVILRNGSMDSLGRAQDATLCWIQENCDYDIIKYRKAK